MIAFLEISRRACDKYHNLEDDEMVKSIFNSGKHKARVGMKIPSWMITDEINLTKSHEELKVKQNEDKVKERLMAEEIEKLVEGTKNVEENEVDSSTLRQNDNQNDPDTSLEPRTKKSPMAAFIPHLIFLTTFLHSLAAQRTNGSVSVGASLTATTDGTPWLSSSGEFAFGFQQVQGNENFLLSIWYDKIPDKTIVWYPRNGPMVVQGSKVELTNGLGLVLSDPQGRQVWSSGSISDLAYGTMNDTGNFMLVGSDSRKKWESFNFPADTILPTQSMARNGVINSKMSKTNFAAGRFQLRLLQDGNLVLINTLSLFYGSGGNDADAAYYTSGTNDDFNSTNSGEQLIVDATGYMYILRRSGERFDPTPRDALPSGENYFRATLDSDGVFTQYYYPKNPRGNTSWEVLWSEPNNMCEIIGSGACGLNNVCILNANRPTCECPHGFSLFDSNDPHGDCKPHFSPSCDEVAIYRSNQCWKKKLPLSNGRKDVSLNVKAFLKYRKRFVNDKVAVGGYRQVKVLEFFDYPGLRQGVEDLRELLHKVSNDDIVATQKLLKDKQPEEKTNTDYLVKEQEKEYQTGWKIKTGNVLDSYNKKLRLTWILWSLVGRCRRSFYVEFLVRYFYLLLYTFNMHPGKSQSEYVDEFHKLVGDLTAIDTAILDEDKALLLLTSLPSSYDNFMTEAKGDGGEGLYMRGRSGQIDIEHGKYSTWSKSQGRSSRLRNEDHVSSSRADGYDNADVMMAMSVEELLDWIMDSGGSYHITYMRDYLVDFEEYDVGNILLGDRRECLVYGTCKVQVQMRDGSSFVLDNTRYVLELRRDLISLGTLEKVGFIMKMQSGKIKVIRGSLVVLSGTRRVNCVYTLDGQSVTMKALEVRKQLGEYQTGWKIKTRNVLDSFNQWSLQQCIKRGVTKHLGVVGIQQQIRSPSSAIGFKTHIDMLGFLGWLASIKQGMLEPVKVKCIFLGYYKTIVGNKLWRLDDVTSKVVLYKNIGFNESEEYQKTFIGSGVGTGSMQVLHGFEFEVEPLGDHTFKVELQENADQGAGLQEAEIWVTKGKQVAKGNVLGLEIIRDQSVYQGIVMWKRMAGADMLDGFDRGLLTNVQVFVNFDYAMGRSIIVMSRSITGYVLMIQGCAGSLKANLQHIEALSITKAGYMTNERWLKGLLTESGYGLRLVACIVTCAFVKCGSRFEVPAQVEVAAYRY
nr:G-type lectin S-receptor-like serine/threonine-protein kinase LECRK3 [Tanacetum cinerariifolium]